MLIFSYSFCIENRLKKYKIHVFTCSMFILVTNILKFISQRIMEEYGATMRRFHEKPLSSDQLGLVLLLYHDLQLYNLKHIKKL